MTVIVFVDREFVQRWRWVDINVDTGRPGLIRRPPRHWAAA